MKKTFGVWRGHRGLPFRFRGARAAQPGASAQSNPQEPVDSHTVIRSETRLVLLDTVVTDKKGNYVRDLTQKDFKVYEDNKEQQITTFSLESGANISR